MGKSSSSVTWQTLLTILTLLGVLAACSGVPPAANAPADAAPTSEQAAESAATDARVGGTYRFLGSDFDSVDPAVAGNFEDWWSMGTLLYNQLYAIDATGKLAPELAADWPEISEDGLVYTIPLRKGVKFHNGEVLTAADVKYTFERTATVGWGGDYLDSIVGSDELIAGSSSELTGLQIVDDFTVQFTLKEAKATFLYDFVNSTFGIVPQKAVEEAGEAWGTSVSIGTGPFKFVEWRPGEVVIYERNPEYWKLGLPYLERIEIYLNVNDANAILQWESGDAEFTYQAPPAELARILQDPTLAPKVRTDFSTFYTYMTIHVDTEPFNDVRVRQAVAHALNKAAYAQKAGLAEAAEGPYSPIMAQFDEKFLSNYQYDPAKAKELLKEAGYPDGIKGIGLYSGGTGPEVGELVQQDLKAVGIEVELFTGDYSIVQDRAQSGEIPMTMFGAAADFPDANGLMTRFLCPNFAAGETLTPGRWCDERINEMAGRAEKLPLDSAERTQLYRDIQNIVVNEGVAQLFIYRRQSVGLGQDYVHDDNLHPVYFLPRLEEAWMDPR